MKHTSNWGKHRAPNCECTYRFTCRACLDNAPKYFWTPNKHTAENKKVSKKDK